MEKKILVTRSSMPPKEEYMQLISSLWDSHWLTNFGRLHEELEDKLQAYMKTGEVTLFNNGHTALEMCLQAMEIDGEVITTPFTFISTTNAIVRSGLTPVFCDVDPYRWTLDAGKIEELITSKTSAILAVHVYGIPCDVENIERIAKKHELKVIYDAAHAFGVRYQDMDMSRYGDVSMYSFHATKTFHTIEGGACVYTDADFGKRLARIRDFGLLSGGEEATYIGGNGKLSEFHAAMGLCNIRHIEEEIRKRKCVSDCYDALLGDVSGLKTFPHIKGLTRNYAYYPVVVTEEFGYTRDEIILKLREKNIFARRYFYPLTNHFSCYTDMYGEAHVPVATYLSDRILCLPIYAELALSDVEHICRIVLSRA